MIEQQQSHHSADRFLENTGYLTFPATMPDRFVETGRNEKATIPRHRIQGYTQWQISDCASIHLTDPLPWTLIEVRITQVIAKLTYQVAVTQFDGQRQTLGGISIGDLIELPVSCFFAVWAAGDTRGDGEGPHKIYHEGSARRLGPETDIFD